MKTIFDNAQAKKNAFNARGGGSYFTSSTFEVPCGGTGHLILTAPTYDMKDVSFQIFRIPTPLKQEKTTSDLRGVKLPLNKALLPETPVRAQYKATEYKEELADSMIYLGQSYRGNGNIDLNKYFSHRILHIPGTFVLYAHSTRNAAVLKENPIIVEYGSCLC